MLSTSRTAMDARGSSNPGEASTSSSVRPSRIQFPEEAKGPAHSAAVENATRQSGIGLGPPPILQRPSPVGQNTSNPDKRRRVRSVDATAVFSEPTQSPRTAEGPSTFKSIRRRTLTQAASGSANSAMNLVRSTATFADLGTLSDEYTLDPGILEDVQRALKLKARREARLRALQASSARGEVLSKSDRATISSQSAGSSLSPMEVSFPTSTPPTSHVPGPSNESDIDFSPSVGSTHLHPVPTSSNDGITLDWSRSVPAANKPDHRRWTLSLSKGKSKERHLSLGKGVMESQDIAYSEKLKKIKEKARQNTLRKAAITSEQLHRRYNILYSSLISKTGPLNLGKVVGWYGNQEPIVRSTLDQAEPLTWLKHILDKRGAKASSRLPWHVTALIVEEYLKSQTHPESDSIMNGLSATGSPSTVESTRDAKSLSISPSSVSPGPLIPSLSRKRSYDGYVSFEPIVEPGREYVPMEAPRRPEGYARHWRHSLPTMMDTPRSSFSSILTSSLKQQPHIQGELSPASSRGYLRDLVRRRGRQRRFGSDGESSARASLSDAHPHSEGEVTRPSHLQSANISLHSVVDSGTDKDLEPLSRASSEAGDIAPSPARGAQVTGAHTHTYQSDGESRRRPPFVPNRSMTEGSYLPRVVVPPRRNRVSLPLHPQPDEESDQHEIDEEMERKEYERRAQMLEDAMAQNNRIRQLLQRVATSVKEYQAVRESVKERCKTTCENVPQDVIDAFSHDPAAVTGSTRKWKGWRAVEDIHTRLRRQTHVLSTFIAEEGLRWKPDSLPSVFHNYMDRLLEALHRLDVHRQAIEQRANAVAQKLSEVKPMHVAAKRDYNQTVAHTSVVYDELSLIVRLEESYKDNYQQLWEFGMDALTFLLDTVTPFWRNYGKVIGEDVQDFLIIPWYRNEFTGEAKRYLIKHLPRRSLRHWLGLLLFFNLSFAVLVLQARAAIFVSSLYRLSAISHTGLWWLVMPIFWTGFFIQWIAVLIECATVGAQLAVVMWWFGWALNIFS